MYPLGDLPMLVFLIRRLKNAHLRGRIVVATTEQPEDDAVVAWAEGEGVPVVRGETDDVLSRYLKCLHAFPSDFVIRVTADNPLTEPAIISGVIEAMEADSWDYVDASNGGFPCGSGVDAFSATLLEFLHQKARGNRDREHINAYVLQHKENFRCHRLRPPSQLARPDVRLTVDTQEDWERMHSLLGAAPYPPTGISLHDAIKISDQMSLSGK